MPHAQAKELPISPATGKVTEEYAPPDPVLLHAMSWAVELGVGPVTPGAGAVLRLLAAATRAKSVVEIGTGTGVSGLWLLRGMRPEGVLTSIDIEPDLLAMARQSFAAAGFTAGRARLIPGAAREVLPRLADGAYDLVFVHHDPWEYQAVTVQAARLLRPGGLLVLGGALAAGRVPDPTIRDPDTVTVREAVKSLRDADEWLPAIVPTADGLLCAVKR